MNPSFSFYDTMHRAVSAFEPLNPPVVRIYTCGPTVYRYAHIGNLRTYISADLIRRALVCFGYEVKQIVNITDVGHMTDDIRGEGEDKMLLASKDEMLSPEQIASKYTIEFLRHCKQLNILPAHSYPKASEHIPEMIEIISALISKGHAYERNGTVYFDVDSFPRYGSLSRNSLDALKEGHRIEEIDPDKKNHYDFTLWRSAGERRLMKWPSPWGEGYPGWHIECSAMSIKHLGSSFDIHTGGSDNIFPHHEDEIAQSEAFTGERVVRHWFHAHHLMANGRRMAKSAGNYYTLDDIVAKGIDPLAFRFLVLQVKYRHQMNFTWPALGSAAKGLDNLRSTVARWGPPSESLTSDEARGLDRAFTAAIGADLDTPKALSILSSLSSSKVTPEESTHLVRKWDGVLGLDLARAATPQTLPEDARTLLAQREAARAARDFALADDLRVQLGEMGVAVMDTEEGTEWKLEKPPL